MSRTRWDMEEHAEEDDRLTAMLVTSQGPRVIAGGSRAGGQGSLTLGGKGRCGQHESEAWALKDQRVIPERMHIHVQAR